MIKYFKVFVILFPYLSFPKTVLLFLGIFILFTNNPIYSLENFKVIQTNTLFDQSGLVHLYGQIKNISNESQKDVTVSATFYDKHGKYIGNASGIASVRSINSGQVSPFEIIFLDKEKSKLFSDYALNLTSKIGNQKPESIVLGTSKSRPDLFGYYYVSGRILNIGGEAATNVLAIASFFDDKGKIIGLSSAIAEPSNMTSGSMASFTIVMDDKLQSSKIKNYSLIIDSDQYVSK
jgi:hypothetical protein